MGSKEIDDLGGDVNALCAAIPLTGRPSSWNGTLLGHAPEIDSGETVQRSRAPRPNPHFSVSKMMFFCISLVPSTIFWTRESR
jgi:hypothetical protein